MVPALLLAVAVQGLSAWGDNTVDNREVLYNPNWNITITDYGYSDWLFDNTPGFEGREYLSGEWAAAIGYVRSSGDTRVVNPTWLEPGFSFPDWTTNSNFVVKNPITITGTAFGTMNAMASSSLINTTGELQIDIAYRMIDTITGMQMGIVPASSLAAAKSIESNRYVLQQTYTITNTSSMTLNNINFFQFMHALQADTSTYDNRSYTGALSTYRYDITQSGTSIGTSGVDNATCSLTDYIGFGASVAPVGVDNGYYGQVGIDDHAIGKPSQPGVHWDIEALQLDSATSNTLSGVDHFAPLSPNQWVAGAQQFNLGSLAAGQSVSLDVVLSVKTGTAVFITPPTGGGGGPVTGGGSANGGARCVGGVDFTFDNITKEGDFFAEFSLADSSEIAERILEGEFGAVNFVLAGDRAQLFELEYDGEFDGDVTVTFCYDPALLGSVDPATLHMYHYVHGAWQDAGGIVNATDHTLSITTASLSPFIMGVAAVPEPASLALFLGGIVPLLMRRRR